MSDTSANEQANNRTGTLAEGAKNATEAHQAILNKYETVNNFVIQDRRDLESDKTAFKKTFDAYESLYQVVVYPQGDVLE